MPSAATVSSARVIAGVTLYRALSLPPRVPNAAAGGLPPHSVFPSAVLHSALGSPKGSPGEGLPSCQGRPAEPHP